MGLKAQVRVRLRGSKGKQGSSPQIRKSNLTNTKLLVHSGTSLQLLIKLALFLSPIIKILSRGALILSVWIFKLIFVLVRSLDLKSVTDDLLLTEWKLFHWKSWPVKPIKQSGSAVLVKCCVLVRCSDHGGGAHRQQRVDSCEVSVVSERRPTSQRPRSLSASQKAAGQLERRRHACPTHQVIFKKCFYLYYISLYLFIFFLFIYQQRGVWFFYLVKNHLKM